MSKWFGKIGYEMTVEEPEGSGIWVEKTIEKEYYGEILRNRKVVQNSENLNDNINISNRLSILSEPFINDNASSIRYVTYMGSKWKVNSVDVEYPRLILDLGGVYNA